MIMKKNDILIGVVILLGVFAFTLNILYADNTPYSKDNPKGELAYNEVCVYTAAGYFGYEKCWKQGGEGEWLIDKLPPEFINTISSIRLGENVGCLMFEHDYYEGDRFFCSKNIIDLSKEQNLPGWNDQIESLQIVPRKGTIDSPHKVCVYNAAGYIGHEKCWKIEPWQRYVLVDQLPSEFRNTISSIRMSEYELLYIFEDAYFAGEHEIRENSCVDLDKVNPWSPWMNKLNDNAESLIFMRGGEGLVGVWLYENEQGRYTEGHKQFFPLPELRDSYSQKKTLLKEEWMKNIQTVGFYYGWPKKEDVFINLYDANGNVLTLPSKDNPTHHIPGDSEAIINLEPLYWHNRVQSIRVYAKPPPQIETAAPKPSPQHDKATNTGYLASLLAKKYPNLSGTWNSNVGLVYKISQNGNKISYEDPMMHKPVNGTVEGKTVTVSWMEGNALKELKGTITSVGNSNMAKQINWVNGAIFNRLATPPSMTATPKLPQQSDKAMATGYVLGKVVKQYPELFGTWNSNIGLVYQISQNGNKISYQDPMMHKPVSGTIDGKTVTVSWTEGNAVKNLKGTITLVGGDGKAKRIEWENSVVFNR